MLRCSKKICYMLSLHKATLGAFLSPTHSRCGFLLDIVSLIHYKEEDGGGCRDSKSFDSGPGRSGRPVCGRRVRRAVLWTPRKRLFPPCRSGDCLKVTVAIRRRRPDGPVGALRLSSADHDGIDRDCLARSFAQHYDIEQGYGRGANDSCRPSDGASAGRSQPKTCLMVAAPTGNGAGHAGRSYWSLFSRRPRRPVTSTMPGVRLK